MKTRIFDLLKTDHELYKQWSLGLTDPGLTPIVTRIELPKDNIKKVVLVLPSFLSAYKISSKKSVLVFIIKEMRIVTMYYCDHPNYLFKKEKESEFQIIY